MSLHQLVLLVRLLILATEAKPRLPLGVLVQVPEFTVVFFYLQHTNGGLRCTCTTTMMYYTSIFLFI
jgi:hypothetical protein